MAEFTTITYAVEAGIATVTLNRPHYRNAFGRITTVRSEPALPLPALALHTAAASLSITAP